LASPGKPVQNKAFAGIDEEKSRGAGSAGSAGYAPSSDVSAPENELAAKAADKTVRSAGAVGVFGSAGAAGVAGASNAAVGAHAAGAAAAEAKPFLGGSGKNKKILFLDVGYFLNREAPKAARELGASVTVWSGRGGDRAEEEDYQRLLRQIKEVGPDLVLTINHLAFDAEGILEDIFRRLGLPAASWFVDSPAFILGAVKKTVGDVFTFSWDRDYLPVLKALGYKKSSFLPLASDDSFFPAGDGREKCVRKIAFVGESLTAATEKYLKLAGLEEKVLPKVDELAREFSRSGELVPGPDFDGLEKDMTDERLLNLKALITWRASRLRRREVLSAMPPESLSINGDEGWLEMFPEKNLGPRLGYYDETARHYRSSAVNINVTSAQMKTGLNQRVFDVPACGAFLLTDRRSQLDGLFEADKEVVTYQTPEEARDKALFYLSHEEARRKIAERGRKRVQKDHLYRRRLDQLLKTVFGPAEA
jgi:spore maturation protein CgeB